MPAILKLVLCVIVGLGAAVPPKLSETGLYSNSLNRIYGPQYPLWTDGAKKRRWVYLPPGEKIIVDNPDQWIFPKGTKFWKEFSFESHTKTRRVETRYIEKVGEGDWRFASYLWNEAETEAVLAPEEGVKDYFPISGGVSHSIPSVTDCLRCHRKQEDGILGFDALQLSEDRDPGALHAEALPAGAWTLGAMIKEGKFNTVPAEFKGGRVKIPSGSPLGRSVYGYFHANCASCHSPGGSSMHVGMNLAFSTLVEWEQELPAYRSSVDKKCTVFQFPNEPQGKRVVRGDPDKSVLVRMMESLEVGHMPPIGTVIRDGKAIQKIREWVSALR